MIYVGDGAPTVGELEADGLLERIARLPAPLRLYAVGVGSDANLDLLEALTRGGGLALRVEERSQAADAALRLLGHATRPVAQRVTVDLGTGIENVYPRRPVDVVEGEILSVSGRIREQPPQSVHVHGTIAGTEFDEELPIQTLTTEQSTDLRLRWAGERLRQLLLEGAGREEVAELGVRYGLITPFSSYYVPSAQELNQYGPMGLRWIDRPDLLQEVDLERRASASGLDAIFAVAMGPFAIAGCAGGDDAPAAVSSADSMEEPGWATPTSEEATAAPSPVMEVPPAEPEPALAPPGATPTPAPVVAAPAPSQPTTGAGSTTTGAFFGRQQAGEVLDPWQAPPADDAPVAGLDGVGAGGGGYAQGAAMPDNAAVANLERRESARTRGPSLPMRLGGRTAEDRGDMNRDMDEIVARALGEESQAARASGINAVARRRLPPASIDDGEDDSRVSNALDALGLRGNESTTITIRTTTTERGPSHERRQCSDASRLSLDDREELWAERIGAAGGPSGWVSVYRQAIRDCEAPSWRDRRALLTRMLGAAHGVQPMIQLYHLFSSGSARGFLRAAILRRVRSPEDLRAVRGAFGLGHDPDWELVEQVLERAPNEAARIRALRRLAMQYPDSFDLKLRLLEALEVGGHDAEARRLADGLRADARSDAGVRTAVGEMYLRMDREEEARRVFSEIVEFAPLDELARRRLGDLYRAHGWFEDAYRQYQTLASIRPDDPSALLLLAQAAAGTGRIDEALRLEQRLMETAQPGAEQGIARIAQLWTSVRLAKLRVAAREADDDDRMAALERRMRRSGVLTNAGDLRATLVWSHPDAQIGLWAAHPDDHLARPSEIAPEYGIEAFEVPEADDGAYRLEVRRADASSPTAIHAELVLVWHEGREDEAVHVVPLDFTEGRDHYAWTVTNGALADD
ncbi:MAG: tetratricopeptide repeat protein [Sandaracinaceae bacterium]